jgi:DNA modification methylase
MRPYYDQDGITIYHADCRLILPEIDPATVALVIADPPYGMGVVQRNGRASGSDRPAHRAGRYRGTWKGWRTIDGDAAPFDPAQLLAFPRLVLFGANHYASRLPDSGSWLVWDKRNGATPDDNADAELIWTNLGGPVRTYRQCWRGFSREDDGLDPQKHLHPTQKPTKLMIWLLGRFTKPGDLVVDPYCGSGPVPFACRLTGRRCVAMDTDAGYCATTVSRLAQSVLPLEVPA